MLRGTSSMLTVVGIRPAILPLPLQGDVTASRFHDSRPILYRVPSVRLESDHEGLTVNVTGRARDSEMDAYGEGSQTQRCVDSQASALNSGQRWKVVRKDIEGRRAAGRSNMHFYQFHSRSIRLSAAYRCSNGFLESARCSVPHCPYPSLSLLS